MAYRDGRDGEKRERERNKKSGIKGIFRVGICSGTMSHIQYIYTVYGRQKDILSHIQTHTHLVYRDILCEGRI